MSLPPLQNDSSVIGENAGPAPSARRAAHRRVSIWNSNRISAWPARTPARARAIRRTRAAAPAGLQEGGAGQTGDGPGARGHRREAFRAVERVASWLYELSGRAGADMMLAAPRMLAASLRPAARLLPAHAHAATLAPIQSSVACACSSGLEGGGEEDAHSVYACPVCQQPFRRWRNAMRHFKARTRGCSPSSAYARRADRRRSTGRCRRRGSALRNV